MFSRREFGRVVAGVPLSMLVKCGWDVFRGQLRELPLRERRPEGRRLEVRLGHVAHAAAWTASAR